MDSLRSAWEAFHEGDDPPPVAVRPAILASWRRSRALAVPPDLRVGRWARPRRGEDDDRLFTRAGEATVKRLADDLTGCGCVVVLADASGTVLARAGDRAITSRTDAAQMVPGAAWDEAAAGTNGIGLALALGRPAQVLGAEHFCEGWIGYGCTTAPIRHPVSGTILGALTISTRAGAHDAPVVAALVRRAAGEVEHGVSERLVGARGRPQPSLRELERDAILAALEQADGDVTAAAEALGVSRATLYRRLRTYRVLGVDV